MLNQSRSYCILLVIAALLLTGCGESARLSPLSEEATILAFGDSLTLGVGTEPEDSYPAVLSRMLDIKVINAGVSGEVTADGKDRLEALLAQSQADLLVLCHGANDFLHRFAIEDTEKNLRAMVAHAQSLGVEVVLIGVPQFGIWGTAPDFYRRVADDLKVPLDDETLGELETDPAMKSDPVHLNKAGYQKLAEAVVALLVETGAVSAPLAN